MALDRFIQARAGQVDSSGVFSLDLRKAARERHRFFLADPTLWVLRAIQAAVQLQAREVFIRCGRRELEVAFSCLQAPPDPRETWKPEAAESTLRSALEGALLSGRRLLWAVGSVATLVDEKGDVLSFELEESQTRRLIHSSGKAADTFRGLIRVELNRPKGFWKVLRGRLGFTAQLARALRRRCSKVPCSLFLDGRLLNGSLQESGRTLAREYVLGSNRHDVFLSTMNPGYGFAYHLFPTETLELKNRHFLVAAWSWGEPFFESTSAGLQPPAKRFSKPTRLGFPVARVSTEPGTLPLYEPSEMLVNEEPLSQIGYLVKVDPETLIELRPGLSDSFGVACHLQIDLPAQVRGEKGQCYFFRHGVLLEDMEVDLGYPGARVAVASTRLKTDATGFALVRDRDYEEVLHFVKERVAQLVTRTLGVVERYPGSGVDPGVLRALVS